MNAIPIFEFNKSSDLSQWTVVNDGVMGGTSKSNLYINPDGYGTFEGEVSLENNGGFCSVKYDFNTITLDKNKIICLRVKGDGKNYQFRVKTNKSYSHSYVSLFQTSGDWQNIEIPVTEFYPSFRGRKLDIPNYDGSSLEEIAFLIGNKKSENFQLLIDRIEVK